MNLDDYSITCFCLIDEMLPIATKGKRLSMSVWAIAH
jgi:hypothetical protein